MRYDSFFIRFWVLETDSSPQELRGIVEHLQSGKTLRFTNLETLALSIQKILASPVEHPAESEHTGE
jgi:hypothetical protein